MSRWPRRLRMRNPSGVVAEDPVDQLQELGLGERLRQVELRARSVCRDRVPAHEQHGDVEPVVADAIDHVQAALARAQHHVGQDEARVRVAPPGGLRASEIAARADGVASLSEHACEHLQQWGLVLDDHGPRDYVLLRVAVARVAVAARARRRRDARERRARVRITHDDLEGSVAAAAQRLAEELGLARRRALELLDAAVDEFFNNSLRLDGLDVRLPPARAAASARLLLS